MTNKSNRSLREFEQTLITAREELSQRIRVHLPDVFVEHETDDEVALATYSVNRDMSAATLERERKTLEDIETALKRFAKGNYGECESCEGPISDARLRALPWARLCISCASGDSASPVKYLRLRPAS